MHLVFELSNLCAKCFVSKIIFYKYKHFIIIIITFISANRLVAASIVDLLHSVFAPQQQLKAHCTTYVEHADVVKKKKSFLRTPISRSNFTSDIYAPV